MSPEDIVSRLLNPGVLLSMVVAGTVYGLTFLWSLNLRPHLNLFLIAVAPGVIFLLMIWSIRAMQGVSSVTYIALLIDWFLFSVAAFVAVLVMRRWRARA